MGQRRRAADVRRHRALWKVSAMKRFVIAVLAIALAVFRCLAPQPSQFCPNRKPDVGDQGHAEDDNHKRGYLDDGKPSHVKCHDALMGGSPANALI
jgi:hypothetical protein